MAQSLTLTKYRAKLIWRHIDLVNYYSLPYTKDMDGVIAELQKLLDKDIEAGLAPSFCNCGGPKFDLALEIEEIAVLSRNADGTFDVKEYDF